MAATFEALGDFLDDYLELPVTGADGVQHTYRIPSPPAEDGLRIEALTTAAARLLQDGTEPSAAVLDDAEERDIFRLVLGPVHDTMAAELPWTRFRHAALTAMVWITSNRENAAKYWAAGGDPSRLAPNRATRRQQQRASSASATASTTRSRGSTSGTKAASPRAGKAKAAAVSR